MPKSAELRPKVVLEAKRLRRALPLNGKRRSFRKISRELAARGYLSARILSICGASHGQATAERPQAFLPSTQSSLGALGSRPDRQLRPIQHESLRQMWRSST